MKKIASGIILVFIAFAGFLGRLATQERVLRPDVARVWSATSAELREIRGFGGRGADINSALAQITSDQETAARFVRLSRFLVQLEKDQDAQREDAARRLGCEVAWVDSISGWREVK